MLAWPAVEFPCRRELRATLTLHGHDGKASSLPRTQEVHPVVATQMDAHGQLGHDAMGTPAATGTPINREHNRECAHCGYFRKMVE